MVGNGRIFRDMRRDLSPSSAHRSGEQSLVVAREPPGGVELDSFFGPVRVEWDHEAAMTPLGQLPFFIDFLKTAGLFDALVADCPLRYLSPNAPSKRDVLGTAMLSMLAGHKRYAHIAALRCDAVLPELLGMRKIVSEDAIRRAFKAIDETGRGRLAAPTPSILRGAAAGRALDSRRRYDDQAALRSSGRGGPGLQSQEAGASEPLLSHLFDGFDASRPRCRCQSRRRACVQTQRAKPVGDHRLLHGFRALWPEY